MCRQAISHEDKETNTKVCINRDILYCKNRKCLQHTILSQYTHRFSVRKLQGMHKQRCKNRKCLQHTILSQFTVIIGTTQCEVNTFILQCRLLVQTRTCPSPPTVMVAILQVNNLVVTFLIHPAKLLIQYMPTSQMKNQMILLMLVLEWPQANTPTTSPLIPVTIL